LLRTHAFSFVQLPMPRLAHVLLACVAVQVNGFHHFGGLVNTRQLTVSPQMPLARHQPSVMVAVPFQRVWPEQGIANALTRAFQLAMQRVVAYIASFFAVAKPPSAGPSKVVSSEPIVAVGTEPILEPKAMAFEAVAQKGTIALEADPVAASTDALARVQRIQTELQEAMKQQQALKEATMQARDQLSEMISARVRKCEEPLGEASVPLTPRREVLELTADTGIAEVADELYYSAQEAATAFFAGASVVGLCAKIVMANAAATTVGLALVDALPM